MALREFAENGFEKASTNEIVKKANISKGSLFNYFNSKKELYLYLFNYSIEIIEELINQINLDERDIFKRITNIGLKKLYVQKKYSYIFDFLISVIKEESTELKEDIREKIDTIYGEGFKRIYENIDYSLFKEDIDIEKAIEILNWSMLGFSNKFTSQIKSFAYGDEFANIFLENGKYIVECSGIVFINKGVV